MNPRSPNSDLRSPAKLVRWPFLVGFAAALCIAAVSPTLPPTRIAPGTNVTVVTNGVNSFTISASGGSVVMNQNQFDSSSTNIKSGALVTNLIVNGLTNTDLTLSTVPYTDANKKLTSSAVTPTELGYVSGVTSAIQTQFATKVGTSAGSATNLTVRQSSGNALTVNTNALVVDTNNVSMAGNLTVTGRILASSGTYPTLAGIGFSASPQGGLYESGGTVVLSAASSALGFNIGSAQYVHLNSARLNLVDSLAYGWSSSVGSTMAAGFKPVAGGVELINVATGLVNRTNLLVGAVNARAGTSTSTYNAAGLIVVDTTQTGNVGVGVDTLQTNSIAANTLAANGDTLVIEADGTFANTGASKQIILNFGTTAILTLPTSTYGFSAASAWRIRAKIVRTGAATQKASAEIILNNSEGVLPYTFYTTPTNTLSGAVGLWLTGEATADNDIVKEICTVDFKPAP